MKVQELIAAAHGAARAGGWWTNLETGLPLVRNRGEQLMLMVSELVEAQEGLDNDAPDEHLPQYPSVLVECADFCIRLFDYVGGHELDLVSAGNATRETFEYGDLWRVVMHIGRAMEHNRKKRYTEETEELARAFHSLLWFVRTELDVLDMEETIQAKMAYNAQRADHKIENRKLAGGKSY